VIWRGTGISPMRISEKGEERWINISVIVSWLLLKIDCESVRKLCGEECHVA